jgi:hypothetical protein
MLETDNTPRIFFVDFENVKISGLDGLLELNSTDEVFIFYSDNADGITFDVHKNLNETKAKINLQKVEVGSKNALDFQLSSYLGFIINERLNKGNENTSYFIVTKDSGFSCLITYWKNKSIDISIVTNLLCNQEDKSENKAEDNNENKIEDSNTDNSEPVEKLSAILQTISDATDNVDLKFIVEAINKYQLKHEINNALAKKYKDSKKASKIYKAIKPLLADKK